jgi:hypothetical protein
MKTCSFCGKLNLDDASQCTECATEEFLSSGADLPSLPQFRGQEWKIGNLSPADQDKSLVTLLGCRTLLDADMVAGRLRAAGISAFVPDQFLMQNEGFALNAYGYVRVQVSPKDFTAAKELLADS